jgi:hypothetical protein
MTQSLEARSVAVWLRVGLIALLIVGVFAMHNLLMDSDTGLQPHHEMSTSALASLEYHASEGASKAATMLVGPSGELAGAMSDCGGLMALCLAMIVGVSAYVVLRKRLSERILWQLPPPATARPFRAVPPFNCRSPLERSSILRC